jgi:hypothetical protein
VMKRKKKESLVLMAFRKGVFHLVGSPGGGLPFLPHALRMSVPMRCATAGCAQHRQMELMVCLSRSLVVILLAAVRHLVACCFMQLVTCVPVPMACPRSLHPSVSVFSGCRIVVRCVSISCCFADVCVRGPTSSCVFRWFNLMPVGLPSLSKRLMNHSTSCSGRNGLVSSMNELACGEGMSEFWFCRAMSSSLIFLRSRESAMAAQLSLSGHPCAKPSGCWKCRHAPLSVLHQHRFGSLCVWSKCGTMSFSSGVASNRSRHASRLISLNMLVMSESSGTRDTGSFCLLGLSTNR